MRKVLHGLVKQGTQKLTIKQNHPTNILTIYQSYNFTTSNKLNDKGFTDLFKDHIKQQIQNNESVQRALKDYQNTYLAKGLEKIKPQFSATKEAISKGAAALETSTERILESDTMKSVGRAVDTVASTVDSFGLKYVKGTDREIKGSETRGTAVFIFRSRYAREADLAKGYIYNPFTRAIVPIIEIIPPEELEEIMNEIKEKVVDRKPLTEEEQEFFDDEKKEQENEELKRLLAGKMQELRAKAAEIGLPKLNPSFAEEIKITRANALVPSVRHPYYFTKGFKPKTELLFQELIHDSCSREPKALVFKIGVRVMGHERHSLMWGKMWRKLFRLIYPERITETLYEIDEDEPLDSAEEFAKRLFAELERRKEEHEKALKKTKEGDKAEEDIQDISELSETALVLRALKARDPKFNKDVFLNNMETNIIPEILMAYFSDDTDVIKRYVSESCFRQIFLPRIQERLHTKLKLDAKVLSVSETNLLTIRHDAGNPSLVISCSVQYIHCVRNEKGEIVEGGPKDIRMENQIWVVKQDETQETDDWYISEVSMMIDPVKIV